VTLLSKTIAIIILIACGTDGAMLVEWLGVGCPPQIWQVGSYSFRTAVLDQLFRPVPDSRKDRKSNCQRLSVTDKEVKW